MLTLFSVRLLTNTMIFALALYAAVYGVTYAYRMHYLVNALCFWLYAIHLTNGPLKQWIFGPPLMDGHVKKRP